MPKVIALGVEDFGSYWGGALINGMILLQKEATEISLDFTSFVKTHSKTAPSTCQKVGPHQTLNLWLLGLGLPSLQNSEQ